MDRGAWWFTVHGGRKVLGMTEHMYNNKIISMLFVKVRCLRSYLFLVSCLSNFLFITMYPENRDELQLPHTVICIAQCKSELSVHWGIIHAALTTPLKPCQPGSSYPRSLIKASARQEGQGRSPVTQHSCIHSCVMGILSVVVLYDPRVTVRLFTSHPFNRTKTGSPL